MKSTKDIFIFYYDNDFKGISGKVYFHTKMKERKRKAYAAVFFFIHSRCPHCS